MSEKISIRGARVHNLKSVNIDIPKNKLVVITGLSGSGKSSLAFDTIYAEGQRRYAESLSSFARQFMDVKKKPDVDKIEGLSPTIAIDQKFHTQNPRSTVGTATETYDYLRLLFSRVGDCYCPDCNVLVKKHNIGGIVENIKKKARGAKEVLILSPILRQEKTENGHLLERIEKSGFNKIRINKHIYKIHELLNFHFEEDKLYDVELVIETIKDVKKENIPLIIEKAMEFGNGIIKVLANKDEEIYSVHGICPKCNIQLEELDIRHFSFNSPNGACKRCTGLGVTKEVNPKLVIPNNRLTLAEGAIQPWTRITGRQSTNQKLMAEVAKQNKFSLDVPVKEMNKKYLDIIMQGTGDKVYNIDGKKMKFAGVIPSLLNKYLETNSDYIRKEIEQYMIEAICPNCNGQRLRSDVLAVRIDGKNIADFVLLDIEQSKELLKKVLTTIKSKQKLMIAKSVIKELDQRFESLIKVGLAYLTLDRSMNTLSGGEVTRVRLATQLTTGLNGVIYVLDEPSVGLHPRDNKQLIQSLKKLRDLGNTVIVVEHDCEMMQAADYLVDVGPGAGLKGGKIVAQGTIDTIKKEQHSLTGEYLSKKLKVEREVKKEKKTKKVKDKFIEIKGAEEHNLKNVDVKIPLGKLVCFTGVSGSGKSTLVIDILGKALSQHFHRAKTPAGKHKEIKGLKNIDKVIAIDQSPIGRTPRSNPATYTNVFTPIRDLFANLQEAKMYNYGAGKFSFNVKGGGRCETCAGEGYIRIPMQFLADVFVECPDCAGTRYSKEALEIHYRQKNISEVLNMTVNEAWAFFNDTPTIANKLDILRSVGLGYIRLGQPATTLSGGEAQRVKLATELARVSTGKTLYILDEPTTGLHFEDIKNLLNVLNKLVEKGNTVVIIEHNTDVIKCSDYIIDLGPGGGRYGGEVVAAGTPAEIVKNKKSFTAKIIK